MNSMYVQVGNERWGWDGSSTTDAVLTVGDSTLPYTTFNWEPYTFYWPNYTEDKVSKSFRIVRVLMDKKLVKCNSVNQFVDLVDEISKVI